MPRKSKARTMFTGRWVRWFVFNRLSGAFPAFGRYFNFPTRRVAARKIAAKIFDDHRAFMPFDPPGDLYQTVLEPSRLSDAGETSSYPQRRTTAYRFCGIVEDCDINTLDMRLVHRPSFCVVDFWDADVPASLLKPARLAARPARPDALYLCAGSTSNYYHFLMDFTLPLVSALTRFGDEIGPLVVLVRADAPKFAHDILAALSARFPSLTIERVEGEVKLERARALFLIRFAQAREWVPFDREDIETLRATLSAYYRLSAEGPTRDIYVSRRGAKLRALSTEGALIGELERRGFEAFTPRADDHAAQVATFGAARSVVAVHGAALTNLIFCREGTTLVELFPRDHVKSPYLWIAHKLGLRYVPVFGSAADARQGFSLAPEVVTAALDRLA